MTYPMSCMLKSGPLMTNYAMCLCLLLGGLTSAKNPIDKEPLVRLYSDESPGILQITFWPENFGQGDANANVDGTGFLVGREGYFITAAHVLQRYDARTHHLTAVIRQREFGGFGMWFDVVEKDEKHDVALCKILYFSTMKEPKGKLANGRPAGTFSPFVSLPISSEKAVPGQEVAILGFPLGSWASPVIQGGNVGATNAMLDAVQQFPAGRADLLVVSIAGNHGDSGCPLIDTYTGKVIGLIIQYVPAPLVQGVQQQSGLMVAIPAKWITEILDRNHVSYDPVFKSEDLVLGKAPGK
jgi:S1-C subfamily serine protease